MSDHDLDLPDEIDAEEEALRRTAEAVVLKKNGINGNGAGLQTATGTGQDIVAAQNGAESLLQKQCWNQIGVWGDSSCPALKEHVHCRNCPIYVDAASRLLDRELPDGYRREWTQHVAAAKKTTEHANQSAVVFRLGNEWFAVPTRVFLLVAEPSPMHTVPRRRGGILAGMVNIRGELMLCVSLEHILGLARAGAEGAAGSRKTIQGKRMLVLQRETSRVAVAVSEVASVRRFAPTDVHPTPSTISRSANRFSTGLLPTDAGANTIALLDDELLFHAIHKALSE